MHTETEVVVEKRPALSLRQLAFGVLLLACLPLIFFSARMTLAAIYSFQADSFLADWAKTGAEPDPAAWEVARQAAQSAIDLNPVANGEYYDRLGRIHEWRQHRHLFGDVKAAESRREAVIAYRASLAARPTWPYSWNNLAYAKLRLLELDEEFQTALHQAFKYGPWRLLVNRRIAEIGLIAWPSLDPLTRQLVLESARRTVLDGPGAARALEQEAKRTGMLEVLCATLPDDLKAQRKICR